MNSASTGSGIPVNLQGLANKTGETAANINATASTVESRRATIWGGLGFIG